MTSDNPRQQQSLNALKSVLVANISTSNSIMAKALLPPVEAGSSRVRDHQQDPGCRAGPRRRQAHARGGGTPACAAARPPHRTAIRRHRDPSVVTGTCCSCCWAPMRSGWCGATRSTSRGPATGCNLLNADLEGAVERAHRRAAARQRGDPALRLYRQPRPALAAGQRHGLHRRAGGGAEPLERSVERRRAERRIRRRRGCAGGGREDMPEAIGFIRSSTEKMDRLINAILQAVARGPPRADARAGRRSSR